MNMKRFLSVFLYPSVFLCLPFSLMLCIFQDGIDLAEELEKVPPYVKQPQSSGSGGGNANTSGGRGRKMSWLQKSAAAAPPPPPPAAPASAPPTAAAPASAPASASAVSGESAGHSAGGGRRKTSIFRETVMVGGTVVGEVVEVDEGDPAASSSSSLSSSAPLSTATTVAAAVLPNASASARFGGLGTVQEEGGDGSSGNSNNPFLHVPPPHAPTAAIPPSVPARTRRKASWLDQLIGTPLDAEEQRGSRGSGKSASSPSSSSEASAAVASVTGSKDISKSVGIRARKASVQVT